MLETRDVPLSRLTQVQQHLHQTVDPVILFHFVVVLHFVLLAREDQGLVLDGVLLNDLLEVLLHLRIVLLTQQLVEFDQ